MAANNRVIVNIQDDIEDELGFVAEEGEGAGQQIVEENAADSPQQSWSSRFMSVASVVAPPAAAGAFAYGYNFILEQATMGSYLLYTKDVCINETTSYTLSEYYQAGYYYNPCPSLSNPWNLPAPIDSIPQSPVADNIEDPFIPWQIVTAAMSMAVTYGVVKYRQYHRQSVAPLESHIAECDEESEQLEQAHEKHVEALSDDVAEALQCPIYATFPQQYILFYPSGRSYSFSDEVNKMAIDPLTRQRVTEKRLDHTMSAISRKVFTLGDNKNIEFASKFYETARKEYVDMKEQKEFFASILYAIAPIPPLAVAVFALTTKEVYIFLSQLVEPDACNGFLVATNYTGGTSAAYARGLADGANYKLGPLTCYEPIKSDPLQNGPHLARHSDFLVMPAWASSLILLGGTAVIFMPLMQFISKKINVASLKNALCTNHNTKALQAGEQLPLAVSEGRASAANYGSIDDTVDNGDDASRALLLRFAILLCDREAVLWCPIANKPFILLALGEAIKQECEEGSKEEQKSAASSQIAKWQGLLFCGNGRAFDSATVLANPNILEEGSACPCDGTPHKLPAPERKHYTATSFFETLATELKKNHISAAEIEGALSQAEHVVVHMNG